MPENKLKTIHSWDEVPEFENEREEHEFWGSHSLSGEMLENFRPPAEGELPPPRKQTIMRPRKSPVSVRMENDLVSRLKTLAAVKGIGYQTLLRQFVADRVYEEEKREGILK